MIDSGFEPKLFGTKAFALLLYKGTFFFFQFVQTWAGGGGSTFKTALTKYSSLLPSVGSIQIVYLMTKIGEKKNLERNLNSAEPSEVSCVKIYNSHNLQDASLDAMYWIFDYIICYSIFLKQLLGWRSSNLCEFSLYFIVFSKKILKLVFIFYNYFYIDSFIYIGIGKPV